MQEKRPISRKKSVIELIAENPDGMGRFVYRCALSIFVLAVAIRVVIYKDLEFGIVSAAIGGLSTLSLNFNKLFNRQV